jgi:uncharacterized protein DUF4340
MKLRNTLIALAFLASLGGVLYYLNKHPQTSTPTGGSAEKKKLFSFQASQVTAFTIETPNQPAVTIRRAAQKAGTAVPDASEQQWEVVAPAGVHLDNSQVQTFVNGLGKFEYTPLEPQTPSSLGEFGLDQSAKTFQFEVSGGQTVTLSVGKENPGGSSKYAILSGTAGLFLLDNYDSKDLVDKTLFDLRDKRVLPAAVDKAKQITLKFDQKAASAGEAEKARQAGLSGKPPRIVITRQSNGNWQLSDPDVRTDFGNTNYFVTTVSGAQMAGVEDENPKSLSPYGLDRPSIRLEVTAEDGSTHTLLVGNKKVKKEEKKAAKEETKEGEKIEAPKTEEVLGYYAKNSDWPVVFTINQVSYDQLNQDLDSYRNRYLFDFETSNARRVEITGPSTELRLDRKGDDWLKGGDSQKKVDSSKVESFLNAVHTLRIQHFTQDRVANLAEYGLDKPWIKVKVTFSEANTEETVLFGKKNKKFFASRPDRPSVYEMSPSEPDDLEKKLKDLTS